MLHPCLYSGYFVASGLQLAITSSILRSRTLALTCYAWLLKVSNGTCTPLGIVFAMGLSRLATPEMASQEAE
jgi:hypothetical protein